VSRNLDSASVSRSAVPRVVLEKLVDVCDFPTPGGKVRVVDVRSIHRRGDRGSRDCTQTRCSRRNSVPGSSMTVRSGDSGEKEADDRFGSEAPKPL
jgi:hypothetical protein